MFDRFICAAVPECRNSAGIACVVNFGKVEESARVRVYQNDRSTDFVGSINCYFEIFSRPYQLNRRSRGAFIIRYIDNAVHAQALTVRPSAAANQNSSRFESITWKEMALQIVMVASR